MNYFEQIVFSPLPKIVTVSPRSDINARVFDHWIVGASNDTKVVYAKCPMCGFVTELMHVEDEAKTRKDLSDNEPYYYYKLMRECPNKAKHKDEACQTISNK